MMPTDMHKHRARGRWLGLLTANVTLPTAPFLCSIIVSLSLFLSISLSTLDRRRVVAPSMLTDPPQHSKHQKERALCSWWPAPPSIFVDDLVVSSRCQTVLSPVVTWLRDVGVGVQEQPDPYAWRGQKKVYPPTYSITVTWQFYMRCYGSECRKEDVARECDKRVKCKRRVYIVVSPGAEYRFEFRNRKAPVAGYGLGNRPVIYYIGSVGGALPPRFLTGCRER